MVGWTTPVLTTVTPWASADTDHVHISANAADRHPILGPPDTRSSLDRASGPRNPQDAARAASSRPEPRAHTILGLRTAGAGRDPRRRIPRGAMIIVRP